MPIVKDDAASNESLLSVNLPVFPWPGFPWGWYFLRLYSPAKVRLCYHVTHLRVGNETLIAVSMGFSPRLFRAASCRTPSSLSLARLGLMAKPLLGRFPWLYNPILADGAAENGNRLRH